MSAIRLLERAEKRLSTLTSRRKVDGVFSPPCWRGIHPSFLEGWGEIVVEAELTLCEDGLGLFSRLGERDDRIATDGDAATIVS